MTGDHTTAAQKIPLRNGLRKLKNEITTEMRQPKAKHSKYKLIEGKNICRILKFINKILFFFSWVGSITYFKSGCCYSLKALLSMRDMY